jgi:zinc transport system ATP-binding protein
MEATLELYRDSTLLFRSAGKWLYPLFELEDFLATSGLDPASLMVRDKIVGRAAALLLLRLGLRRVQAGVLSVLAREVLDRFQARYSWDKLVDRILCETEQILSEVTDPAEAYDIVCRKAGRCKQS